MRANLEIIDVRKDEHRSCATKPYDRDICQQILAGLYQPINKKTLPTLLLYNERGLRLYDDITTKAPEYYLFPAEEEILRNHANEIVQVMHSPDGEVLPGEVIVELGAGCVLSSAFHVVFYHCPSGSVVIRDLIFRMRILNLILLVISLALIHIT